MISTGSSDKHEATNGWIMGHFSKELPSTDVEVKYFHHKKGDVNESVASNKISKSLSILIRGRFVINFPDNSLVILEDEGDYVYWENELHTWQAVEDSTVITVRWPSIPNDQYRQ